MSGWSCDPVVKVEEGKMRIFVLDWVDHTLTLTEVPGPPITEKDIATALALIKQPESPSTTSSSVTYSDPILDELKEYAHPLGPLRQLIDEMERKFQDLVEGLVLNNIVN